MVRYEYDSKKRLTKIWLNEREKGTSYLQKEF